MAMPTGDSPDKVRDYYLYLQGHHQADGRIATWHVDWMSLAWMWGFVIVLLLILILWIKQYRSTRQRTGIYPIDSFGGFTTELAAPATRFFLLFTAIITGFAVALVVGHIVWGQKF
jgi:fatty acid desaturase